VTASGLVNECEVFTRHISGRQATAQVSEQYAAAHRVLPGMEPSDGHERWLLRVARRGPAACRIADAWARLAAPHGSFRRKLVVLLAILEVTPPFAEELDQPRGGPGLEWLRIAGSGVAFAGALALGVVLFLPVRLAAGRRTA
jgi:hypothetical protein